MQQILDRLWCGNFEDGRTLTKTPYVNIPFARPIILNVSQHPHEGCPLGTFVPVIHYPIVDEIFLDSAIWAAATYQLATMLARWHTVLVHCRLGKSRAPSLCAAYLMRSGFSAEKALQLVKLKRPEADPHPETWRSVVAWAENQA